MKRNTENKPAIPDELIQPMLGQYEKHSIFKNAGGLNPCDRETERGEEVMKRAAYTAFFGKYQMEVEK